MGKPSLQRRLMLSFYLTLLMQLAIYYLAVDFIGDTNIAFMAAIGFSAIFLILAIKQFIRPIKDVIEALDVGVNSFKDKDFSVTIFDDKYQEFSLIISTYNELAKVLRSERMALYQRELLLDTVIQATPVALVLTNDSDHIVYSNMAAKTLLNQATSLAGLKFSDIYQYMPSALFEATKNKENGLITEKLEDENVVYHLSYQTFSLNNQQHHMYLFKNLTVEMSRKENDIWKQVIRLISHELNNSLAPIASLTQSAKKILNAKENLTLLPEMLDTIARRTKHLHQFIEQYASFARLPKPNKQDVDLASFSTSLKQILGVNLHCDFVDNYVNFDATQIEQVLINLVKNAKESGSPVDEIGLKIAQVNKYLVFQVSDAGRGMNEVQLQQALLPFYTTKSTGTGVGLALSNEIVMAHGGKLRLENRKEGGVRVSFSLLCGSKSC